MKQCTKIGQDAGRNRAIFIAVVRVFSNIFRKLIFLMSFVLVLGIVGSAGAGPVPTPWADQTIGADLPEGSADYTSAPVEQLEVTGDGHDIWDDNDDFHYVYKEWTGDCELICRVASFPDGPNVWQKAGLMVRQNLTDGSVYAFTAMTGTEGNGCALQSRPTANSADSLGDLRAVTTVTEPEYIRIVRTGNLFRGYHSENSTGPWTELGSGLTVVMTDPVYIGFAVTSHSTGDLVTVTFDSFSGDLVFATPYPTSPAPGYGETDVPLETNLTWTRGDGTVADEVYFGTESPLPFVTLISKDSQALYDPGDPNLIPSTIYYWQIIEVNFLDRYEGPIWEFSTVSGKASVLFPADGDVIPGQVQGDNIYTWMDFAAGPTAETYECFFSDNREDVVNREASVSLGAPPSPDILRYYVGYPPIPPYTESLVRETTYYWCVDGSDAFGRTFGGDIWKFSIQGYRAFDPSPPNEAIFVEPDVLLTWRQGIRVTEHDVYMGTDWDDVNDAAYDFVVKPPEFVDTVPLPSYQCANLPPETQLYWRIDEIFNRMSPTFPGESYKGDVWEFTTQIFASEYRDKGYLYLSPVPMAEYVRPETRYILVRFEEVSPYDITNLPTFIDVTGEASGSHPGQTKIATDDRTVIFEVLSGFSNDELVTVTLTPTVDPCAPNVVVPYQYQFMVSGPMPPPLSSGTAAHEDVMNKQAMPDTEWEALLTADVPMTAEDVVSVAALDEPMIMSNGVSVPSDFPEVVITVNNNPSPGYLFLEHAGFTMMLDNNGDPVWYRRGGGRDFKVQKNGMITWTQFNGVDENFNNPRSYRAVNGYSTDSHELQIQEDGRYLLLGVRGTTVDMTLYHPDANPSANVNETVIQEFTADDELIFQWRAWDNFDPLDCEPHLANPLGSGFNFTHMNAVDIDEDGHILLSSRHISEVTKINRDTGQIIWRLCGTDPARSDFVFVNDPLNGFSSQHDIRSMGNGRYTIFDNGNLHSPQVSRGVEYELDLDNGTATMVWEYRDGKYAHYMGNTQRLPTGNTLVNFVMSYFPTLVEVDPNGVKRLEIDLIPGRDLYRGFRFPWNGIVDAPYLIVESPPDYITLIFNKFGDPNVDYYRIYGGTTPQPTTVLATSTETLKHLSEGLENGLRYYFRVTAVDFNGAESDYSNEENAVVSFTEPGQNVVLNGDFCQEKDSWIWEVGSAASAVWNIESGVSHFDITSGGTVLPDVQLRQAGIRLVRGKEYVFEFDAWSDLPRIIEAKVGQDESPWTNYSKIGYSSITPNMSHFRYPFTMQDSSDYNARVVFNAGTSDIDVYIDNISLITVLPGDFDFDNCVRFDDLAVLTGEWLEEQSGLIADLQDNGRIDFNDFAIFADSFKYLCSTILVTEKDAKRVLVPTSNIGYDWIGSAEPYDDIGWVQIAASDCPTGVGYENNPDSTTSYTDFIAHDVGAEMFGIMNSCYIRIPFTLDTNPNELNSITLKIRYDDGFVAYINGQELARDKFDALIPDWNDNADRTHDDNEALLLQPFRVNRDDKPDVFNALQLGANILAIHGLNYSTGSSDFLISAELHASN